MCNTIWMYDISYMYAYHPSKRQLSQVIRMEHEQFYMPKVCYVVVLSYYMKVRLRLFSSYTSIALQW